MSEAAAQGGVGIALVVLGLVVWFVFLAREVVVYTHRMRRSTRRFGEVVWGELVQVALAMTGSAGAPCAAWVMVGPLTDWF